MWGAMSSETQVPPNYFKLQTSRISKGLQEMRGLLKSLGQHREGFITQLAVSGVWGVLCCIEAPSVCQTCLSTPRQVCPVMFLFLLLSFSYVGETICPAVVPLSIQFLAYHGSMPFEMLYVQGPVYLPAINSVFFISNRLGDQQSADQHAEMWLLNLETLETSEVLPSVPILIPNGATNWAPQEVLVTQQVTTFTYKICNSFM